MGLNPKTMNRSLTLKTTNPFFPHQRQGLTTTTLCIVLLLARSLAPSPAARQVRNLKTGAITELAVGGLFFAIGHEPASKFLDGQIELDSEGYIKTVPGHTTTNVPGKAGCIITARLQLHSHDEREEPLLRLNPAFTPPQVYLLLATSKTRSGGRPSPLRAVDAWLP